ncbi:type II secretion system minor pseudopilin GspJ [Yersinia hibernica]|uniref:Type II secretion system protein J n=1 Tax=Yersinia hibernica TaxID=2339259 RepID=A0ABX5R417_9GAMM|nr:type II secretion system minor pseudopilin GspJ [Yersinia hibernica]QAX80402.1 type II secretion system protein GspJ [Yersinia hibernica]
MNQPKQQGFTLLEMMLAIALFSIVCLAGYQLLQAVLRNSELTQQHAARLAELQRVFNLMEHDISHARIRPVAAAALSVPNDFHLSRAGKNSSLTLVRDNWRNPAAFLPRSNLEKVTWYFQPGKLERLSHHQPDSQQTQPTLSVTLDNVNAFKLRFWSQGRWLESWDRGQNLPEGVEITLETGDLGPLQRVIFLTVNHEKT